MKALLLILLFSASAQAAVVETPPAAPSPTPSAQAADSAERVNVDTIKEKYWARGDENELGVVQNRMYTKENKLELGLYGGVVTTDPFLTVYSLSASLTYHINEFFSVGVFGMKDYVTPSSALTYLQAPYPNGAGSNVSTNNPQWYLGAETAYSALYGKLSVFGKAIIHYDFHFLLGAGATSTQSGADFTPEIGVGQQFFLTQFMTLRLDYRLMRYDEEILQKAGSPSSPDGTPLGMRANYTNVITLGVSFLFDLFHKAENKP